MGSHWASPGEGITRRIVINCQRIAVVWSGRSKWPRSGRLRLIYHFENALEALIRELPRSERQERHQSWGQVLSMGQCGAGEYDLIVAPDANQEEITRLAPLARDGLFSMDLTDVFPAVAERRDAVHFAINHTAADGNHRVLVHGRIAPKPTYARTFAHVQREAEAELARIVGAYAQTGELPAASPPLMLSPLAPGPKAVAAYAARTAAFITGRASERLRGRVQRWSVGILVGSWEDADLAAATIVPNPPGRYLADPFLIQREGRNVCFVEDFDFACARASISALERGADGAWRLLGPALVEPFHLSFPFMFEYGGALYMIPETHQANEIRLYRCVAFPLGWTHIGTLIEGISAVDTMLFQRGGRWWMLTNISPTGSDEHQSRLHLYWNEDPLTSGWRAHKANPILFDSRIARNGGLLTGADGALYRVRQRQDFARYGGGFSIARIDRIDTSGYAETTVREVGPDFLPGLAGCHHLHSTGGFTAFDILRIEPRG